MRAHLTIVSLLLITTSAFGMQSVRAPQLNPGDSWTYENSNERRGNTRVSHDVITLTRVDSREVALEIHPASTPGPGREMLTRTDWGRVRSVNGKMTLVNQPLSYPLTLGKHWVVDYAEANPTRLHAREQWHMVYTVTGWEDITLPAGTFHALKIEGDGTWTADLPANILVTRGRAPNGAEIATRTGVPARAVSGRFLKTFWYVPEVHRWARSEEDFYDSNNVRTEHVVSTLEAYALAGVPDAASDGPVADQPPVKAAPRHARVHKPASKPHPIVPAKTDPVGLQETDLRIATSAEG